MPHLIAREEAIARILAETPETRCSLCALLGPDGVASGSRLLARGAHTSVVLNRYPRQWGHVLVVWHRHVTTFESSSDAEWDEASRYALRAARVVERTLHPARCYVASLGTSEPDVPTSFPHLHLHVLPVYDPRERPSTVLTWEPGVYEASEPEWDSLERSLKRAWGA